MSRVSRIERRESQICPHLTPTHSHRCALALVVAFALGLMALSASAQPAGRRGFGAGRRRDLHRIEPQPFAVTDWGGRLGVEAVHRRERQTSDRGSEFERRLRRFEEYIELTGHGFVYHPLFMDWRGRVRLGLLQQRFDSDLEGEESIHDVLQEYDATALFLQEKPVRLQLHARRSDDIVRDLFSDIVRAEETNVGADVLFVNAVAPSRLSARHQEFGRTGFSQNSDSTLDTVEAGTRIWPGSNFSTDINYLFRDYQEDFRGRNGVTVDRTTEIRSHDLSLLNTARFGPGGRHRLTTTGRFYDQTGSVDIRQWRGATRLDLELTPRLDSHLSYAYDQVEAETQTTRQHRVNAGLHHRLFESLDTFVEGRWRRTDFDPDGEETIWGGGTRFAYRKTTPRGLLTAGYSLDVDRIDRGEGGGTRLVIDEPIVLVDGVLTFLAQQDVILASVQVTDATGLTIYTLDLDYRLTEVDSRVQIERVFGGAIADGQLVLVDYQFFQPEDIAFTQITQSFNVRHDWSEGLLEGLALYYRLADLRHSGSTGGQELLEFTSHLLGMQYRWRWLEWIEEFEIYDANISPHDSLRSALHAHCTPWPRSRLRAGAEYLIINYRDEPDEDTDLLNLSADLQTRLGRHLDWTLQTLYRKESGRNDETNWGVASFLRWTYRKLSAEAGVRWETRDRSGTDRDDILLYLTVSRAF